MVHLQMMSKLDHGDSSHGISLFLSHVPMTGEVRMLATEIEVKCFHEKLPPSGGNWTSFTKVQ